MAVYQLKDGTTLFVDHAHIEKYLGIALALQESAGSVQMSLSHFMEKFSDAYKKKSSFTIRHDSAEHFVLDLFLDGYIMVLDGSRG